MELPVWIGGNEAGKLRVSKSGLYMIFEAEADGGAEELVRLWAHGGGRSACLGVMQPENNRLVLQRKLSRSQLRDFPDPIEFASDRQEPTGRENDGEEQAAFRHTEAEPAAEEGAVPGAPAPGTQSDMRACPWPAPAPEEGLVWYARPDGSLVSFDGVSTLLALPSGLRRPGGRGTERVIEGRKYLIFRT